MSEVKVNKITPRTNCGTTTLGDSGDTINIPAGVTISNNGTATGFGATGAVNWDVASIKTVDFTATAGVGYFVDTATTGAVDVTLPASPTAGDVVGVADYAKNFNTANCTLLRNGSNIGGTAVDSTLTTNGVAVTLVYVDGTKGWIVTDSGNQSDAPTATYVAATGGCITTCGNFKVHTFLSPGTFTVTSTGNPSGSTTVDYMIVAGGGGGNSRNAKAPSYPERYSGGGGGAGGWRASSGTASGCYSAGPAPLVSPVSAYTVSASPGAYPVVVGGGGPAPSVPSTDASATPGVASSVFCITSAGGGGGGYGAGSGNQGNADSGGSGGGAGANVSSNIGSGNTPPTTPPQGNDGGTGTSAASTAGGGGGGAGGCGQAGVGNPGPPDATGGAGGAGVPSSISFSPVSYAGGGGGGAGYPGGGGSISGCTATAGGGAGGQVSPTNGTAGTVNTGGGGGGVGGTGSCGTCVGGNGGSGIVILRYKYQ